jgi:predicted nucleotidyltransferase component of viral defense system
MKELEEQEIFEIEILEWMKNKGFLEKLIFGGGTMLRLCYDLNRFSVDLDFWTYRVKDFDNYYQKVSSELSNSYELTDSAIKFYTILFEIRKSKQTEKLKIEIRKNKNEFDFQEKIAFSRYSNKQVLLKVFTLEQMMKNKISALLDRKEIRDAYDMEFIAKKGISPAIHGKDRERIKRIIREFSNRDYKVNLGSLLEKELRKYYVENNFNYLLEKI